MRKLLYTIPALLIGMQIPMLADTILPGTQIAVRSDRPIDVARWDRGRIYPAHVARDVMARDGDVAIPAGSYAELIVRQIGPGQFALDLESVTANGQRYVMDTAGPQFNMPRNSYDNGGGLVGQIVGAIAGVQTQGSEIRVPADTILRFNLQEPLHVAGWNEPGYEQNGYHYHHEHDWYR